MDNPKSQAATATDLRALQSSAGFDFCRCKRRNQCEVSALERMFSAQLQRTKQQPWHELLAVCLSSVVSSKELLQVVSVYGLVVLVGLFNAPTIDADMVFAVVVAQMQAVVVFWSHETRMHRGKKLVMV